MFTCETCGKQFSRLANCRRHQLNLHSSSRATELPSTSSTDNNIESRPSFYELVDDDDIFEHGREVLECEYCAMYFLDQEQLDRHEKVYLILIRILYFRFRLNVLIFRFHMFCFFLHKF